VPRVFFLRSTYEPLAYLYHKKAKFVALNKVDDVTASKVLADLIALASKVT
jgi:hypothetical protein